MRTLGRRSLMIGSYAVAWCLLTALCPVLVAVLLVHDLLRRNRLAGLRMLGTFWMFLFGELLGVSLAGIIWLRHRLHPGRDPDLYLEDNYQLQRAWALILLRSAERLLGLRFVVEGDGCITPGPVVVLMRHTSTLDTVLPVVFMGARHGLRLRYVLKKELLLDPCIDIVGHRLPNCFVDRAGDTAREVEVVGRMADGMGPRDGALIYPEGTRYSPGKLRRALASLERKRPELHALGKALTHVLPPRPGGTLALLEHALPQGADVVVCNHVGLEDMTRLHDVLSGALIGSTVRIWFHRIPGASIPDTAEERVRWLFEQWSRIDTQARQAVHPVSSEQRPGSPPRPEPPAAPPPA